MTLAISAEATAMPVKPITPAMIETIKNISTHLNINSPFKMIVNMLLAYTNLTKSITLFL
jgi:hypothetical protein